MPSWLPQLQTLREQVSRHGRLARRDSFHCWAHGESIDEFARAATLLRRPVRRQPLSEPLARALASTKLA